MLPRRGKPHHRGPVLRDPLVRRGHGEGLGAHRNPSFPRGLLPLPGVEGHPQEHLVRRHQLEKGLHPPLHPGQGGHGPRPGAGAPVLVVGHHHDVVHQLPQGLPVVAGGPVGLVGEHRHVHGDLPALTVQRLRHPPHEGGVGVPVPVGDVLEVQVDPVQIQQLHVGRQPGHRPGHRPGIVQEDAGPVRLEAVVHQGPHLGPPEVGSPHVGDGAVVLHLPVGLHHEPGGGDHVEPLRELRILVRVHPEDRIPGQQEALRQGGPVEGQGKGCLRQVSGALQTAQGPGPVVPPVPPDPQGPLPAPDPQVQVPADRLGPGVEPQPLPGGKDDPLGQRQVRPGLHPDPSRGVVGGHVRPQATQDPHGDPQILPLGQSLPHLDEVPVEGPHPQDHGLLPEGPRGQDRSQEHPQQGAYHASHPSTSFPSLPHRPGRPRGNRSPPSRGPL